MHGSLSSHILRFTGGKLQDVEGSRCECNMLDRSGNSLRKQEDSLRRVEGMGNLKVAKLKE